MLPFRLAERRTLLIAIDLVIVELTTLLAFWIVAFRAGWVFDRAGIIDQLECFIFLPVLWFASALLNGFYDPKKTTDLAAAAAALLRTVALVVIVYLFIYFLPATPQSIPRGVVGYQGAASFVLITLAIGVCMADPAARLREVIIVGAGWAGQTIASAIQQYANAHYRVLGLIDDDPSAGR